MCWWQNIVGYGIYLMETLEFWTSRWLSFLNEYDFEMKHIKGKENKVVDALSGSMQVIHTTTMSTCEFNFKNKVKEALDNYEHFIQVRNGLQQ